MKKVNEVIARHFGGLSCEFYRALVSWMDNRVECANQDKSFRALAIEYAKHVDENFG